MKRKLQKQKIKNVLDVHDESVGSIFVCQDFVSFYYEVLFVGGEQREIGVESNILSIHNISVGNRKEMSCISYICT